MALVKIKDYTGLKNRRGFPVKFTYIYRLIAAEKKGLKKAPFKWIETKTNILIETA